jgi:hypothetical protein
MEERTQKQGRQQQMDKMGEDEGEERNESHDQRHLQDPLADEELPQMEEEGGVVRILPWRDLLLLLLLLLFLWGGDFQAMMTRHEREAELFVTREPLR